MTPPRRPMCRLPCSHLMPAWYWKVLRTVHVRWPYQNFFKVYAGLPGAKMSCLPVLNSSNPMTMNDGFYYKLGKRKADAISIVSIAMTVKLAGEKVERARIAMGAVAPVAMRASEAEGILQGETLKEF